jgi:hypothetical protein
MLAYLGFSTTELVFHGAGTPFTDGNQGSLLIY